MCLQHLFHQTLKPHPATNITVHLNVTIGDKDIWETDGKCRPSPLIHSTKECLRWMTLNFSSNNDVTKYILMCSILHYYLCCFCVSKTCNSEHYCRTKPLPYDNLMGFFRLSTNYQQGLCLPEWLPVRDRQSEETERGYMRKRGGWVGGRNVSSRKSCSWGFSLSALWCPLCRADTIWPAGMLLSRERRVLNGGGVNG